VNVRSSHPPLLSPSTEKRFNDQINRIGIRIHWVELTTTTREDRNHERSGVETFNNEKRK
jgi:hypothetical protein